MSEVAQQTKIPKKWRQDVCDILNNHKDKVGISQRARDEWLFMTAGNDNAGGYIYNLCAVLSEALADDEINGIKIDRIGKDNGEIWEFKFKYSNDGFYGKISLRLINKKGTKFVYIYSAHKEERSYL